MQNKKTRILVESSMMIALAVVLDYVAGIYSAPFWPFGGSVSLSLVPLAILAYRHGVVAGVTGGFVMGLVQLLIGPYIVHPVQVLLDYPLPFAMLGLAGLFAKQVHQTSGGKLAFYVFLSTAIASIARLACHVLSGYIFFSDPALKPMAALIASLVYNFPYVLGSYIASAIVLFVLYQRYGKQLRTK
ncbi:MAG TPA: energy-coupled thiamine transporter ThiT [Firmicutes bacterium]|nr:energy-coupled thiamine transporter ThiT [Bacillota bacterium]